MPDMNATVASLFVYPVKSCRGIALSTALLTERGIAHDREWLIVDEGGRFITQREVPRLALLVPALSDTALRACGARVCRRSRFPSTTLARAAM